VKKIEWMVAAGAVAALAGAVYSAGCVNTASDCTLLGTDCGSGGSSTSSTTATGTTTSSTASSGTGGMVVETVCEGASRFGDKNDQAARSVLVGASSDILLSGEFNGSLSIDLQTVNAQADDLFVARFSETQKLKWLKSFPVRYGAVARDPMGAIVVAGAYTTTASFGGPCAPLDSANNFYVAKLDIDGTCQWAKGFNLSMAGVDAKLAVAPSGKIALAGDATGAMDFHTSDAGALQLIGNNPGKSDIFVAELSPAGDVLLAVGFGGTEDDFVKGVAFDAAEGVVLTGSFKSPQIDFGSNLLKNASGKDRAFVAGIGGTKSWSLGFDGGTGEQHPTAVVVDGTVAVVAGDFTDSLGMLTSKGAAFFLIGVDPATGKQTWEHAFDGKGARSIKALAAAADGTLALTGSLDGDVDFGGGAVTSKGGAVVATFQSDGTPLSNLVFGDATAFLPASAASGVNSVSFQGSNLLVAGAFSGNLAFTPKYSIESAGGTDAFLANLSTACP
jgi:hypothetical protein